MYCRKLQVKDGKMFPLNWIKKMYYRFDASKLEEAVKVSKAMVMMLEQLKNEKGKLSTREQNELDYHKARLPALERDLEKAKSGVI